MTEVDITFCFYDEQGYGGDADRDSALLQSWHQRLWSKGLPDGRRIAWQPGAGETVLTHDSELGRFRVSSDTIATTHASYTRYGMAALGAELGSAEVERYERSFYTIGGFIVFPRHTASLNQVRGRDHRIADRFDLTLECIRRHYVGVKDNPLGEVLARDADFFALFGVGEAGFEGYVEYFLLQDLVEGGRIRWFDAFEQEGWDFDRPPLPSAAVGYRQYLDHVGSFVAARNMRIADWCAATSQE